MGPPGTDGVDGQRGEQGDPGQTGPQGIKGDTGEKGDKGDKGDQGEPGTAGSTVGVIVEKGEKGDKGDKCEKGDQGIQGKEGKTGKDGVAGDAGAVGATGPAGKDAQKGRLLWATYGAPGRSVDATAPFLSSLMLPSDAELSKAYAKQWPNMPDWEYDNNMVSHRIMDTTGDVAHGSVKSVMYGYTDADGNYKTDTINSDSGTIPGSLLKSLRAAMGLVDAPHTAPQVAYDEVGGFYYFV